MTKKTIKKIVSLFLFFSMTVTTIWAQNNITIHAEQMQLKKLLNELEKQAGLTFIYSNDLLNVDKKVNLSADNQAIDVILNAIFKPMDVKFEIKDKHIILSPGVVLVKEAKQEIKVKGKITDSFKEPVIGASVFIPGTTIGTSSDLDGLYELSVPADATLKFSCISYDDVEENVNGRGVINIVMASSSIALDDVLVVGYGTVKKRDLTGSVASVKGDVLSKQPVGDAGQAIQGRIAGVSVTAQSGTPGAAPSIRVRGIGTVNNADPLYVVDGVPVNSISYLNPNDITSMEVLKDASSSAIYGSRGANGVILITTKKGSAGRTTVSFNGYYGVQTAINNLDLMSGSEWYGFQEKVNQTRAKAIDLSKVDKNISTNWIDEITRTAAVQNYHVDLSGGKEGLVYSASAGYFGQEGTIKGSDYERLTLRLNGEAKLNDIFTIGTNLSASISTKYTILEANEAFSVMSTAMRMEPVIPVFNHDGSYGYSPYTDTYNSVASIDYSNTKRKQLDLVGSAYLTAKITKNLLFRTSFGVDINKIDDFDFVPEYYVSVAQKTSESIVSRGAINYMNWLWENTLSYEKVFNKKHDFKVMVGYTMEQTTNEKFSASKNGVPGDLDNLHYLDAAQNANSAKAYGNAWESSMISYLARVNYSYDDRYLATASVRVDGSSKFGKENRFATFPSFALAWKLSNEKFFKNLNANWINQIKIRGGWGQIGNQNIGNYLFQNVLTSTAQYQYLYGRPEEVFQGVTAIALGNKNIKWETTESTNIGLDMTLFKNFTIVADYYSKSTKDMLLQEPIPNHLGFVTGPVTNVGSVRNRGFEFSVQYQGEIAKDLFINVGANIATVKNEVLDLGTGSAIVGGTLFNKGSVTRTMVGGSIGQFWGFKTGGLIQTEEQLAQVKKLQPNAELGDRIFLDIDGYEADGKTLMGKADNKLNDADKTYIGSPIPDFTYGFNLSLDYKGFDFAVFFEGVQGNELFNGNRAYTHATGSVYQKSRDMLNYWTPENRNTNIPRINGDDNNDNMRLSDFYIEDGSYLRLKNLQFGYSFSGNWIKKTKIQKLRIYFSAQNLFTITNYSGADPEVGQLSSTDYLSRGFDLGTYPQARTFTGGLNITF